MASCLTLWRPESNGTEKTVDADRTWSRSCRKRASPCAWPRYASGSHREPTVDPALAGRQFSRHKDPRPPPESIIRRSRSLNARRSETLGVTTARRRRKPQKYLHESHSSASTAVSTFAASGALSAIPAGPRPPHPPSSPVPGPGRSARVRRVKRIPHRSRCRTSVSAMRSSSSAAPPDTPAPRKKGRAMRSPPLISSWSSLGDIPLSSSFIDPARTARQRSRVPRCCPSRPPPLSVNVPAPSARGGARPGVRDTRSGSLGPLNTLRRIARAGRGDHHDLPGNRPLAA